MQNKSLLKQPLPCQCTKHAMFERLVFVTLFLMQGIDFSSMAGCGLRVGRPTVGCAERPHVPAAGWVPTLTSTPWSPLSRVAAPPQRLALGVEWLPGWW